MLDKKGFHLLHCAKGGGTVKKHNAIQQDFLALATSAGIQASACNKDIVLLNQAGDTKRGDLMLPQCGFNERNLLLDFTITNPACQTYSVSTIQDKNSSIKRARNTKNEKYRAAAEANDIQFMPMAIECYGALSIEVIGILHLLCERRSRMTGGTHDPTPVSLVQTHLLYSTER